MDPELKKDLLFFDSDESVLPPWMRGKDQKEFIVYACNRHAFDLFQRVHTQWRSDGFSLIGLDYGVVLQLLALQGLSAEDQMDLLEQVQLIEIGYLNERNARKK